MCNVCCKEFQGWCRAFTVTEVILSILQAILLTLFVAFLTFLILHFLACPDKETSTLRPGALTAETLDPVQWDTAHELIEIPTGTSGSEEVVSYTVTGEMDSIWSTLPPDIACTWTPSVQTKSVSLYYEQAHRPVHAPEASVTTQVSPPEHKVPHTESYDSGIFASDQFEGEPADTEKSFIMALVKMKPPNDVSYGCILTVISEFWTLTAASCIESVEEVDSLDTFVIMENFGNPRHGRTHPVSEVFIHPHYQGTNRTYDIVALKSGDKLTSGDIFPRLPTVLDYLSITIGERLTILGFGQFRSINRDAFARRVHAVSVHVVPGAQCAARGDMWSARHLIRGAPAVRGACGAAALCAGPLFARGAPCNYCAGTPLLQAHVLLGLMTEPAPCGAPCEPALYVNLAASRDWLNSILSDN